AAYVSITRRLCSRRSADSASTGVVKPSVKRLRRRAASSPTVRPSASGGRPRKRWSTRSSASRARASEPGPETMGNLPIRGVALSATLIAYVAHRCLTSRPRGVNGHRGPQARRSPAIVTVTGPSDPARGVDVVALGESMVTFRPSAPGRLAEVPSFHRGIGGAESNTACMLARAGHTARCISRVGADPFGDHLLAAIAGHGVDVSRVRRDPDRPTGIYFRTAGDRATDAHEVAY